METIKPSNGKIKIKLSCKHCGHTEFVMVSEQGLKDYNSGMNIQRALPELTPDQREMIISNTCGKCWDKMFKSF